LLVGAFQEHIFQAAQMLRSWSEFMLDLAARPSFAEALMGRITEGHMKEFSLHAR